MQSLGYDGMFSSPGVGTDMNQSAALVVESYPRNQHEVYRVGISLETPFRYGLRDIPEAGA